VYGVVPPEVVAVNVTAVPGVIVVGKVKSVVRARGLILTVADFVPVAAVGVAESVPVTLIVFIPFTL
jgi:hypothetical protein